MVNIISSSFLQYASNVKSLLNVRKCHYLKLIECISYSGISNVMNEGLYFA